ncbi:MAG: prolyl-tRNA synthetase associated domain-containing protein [Clostridiaceae bacterium]|nr:prolyl-tRNA synthetase associated domain-containing protein [Eubacteriales bacterium]
MRDERDLKAEQALTALHIPFVRYEHEAALTMEDCEDIGKDIGACHMKNLFLTNRQGTDFYLVLMDGHKSFRTAEVSKKLGVARLSFATPEQLRERLNLEPGAVTALGLLFDTARAVTVALDTDVLKYPYVCMHPCVSTASLAIRPEDLLKFLASRGNTVVQMQIEGASIA